MTQVAKDLGISSVALARACGRRDIPVPFRGYWRQVEKGKAPPRPPLPPAEADVMTWFSVDMDRKPQPPVSADDELAALLALERVRAAPIVQETLTAPHPLVRNTRAQLRGQKPDEFGVLSTGGEGLLTLRVAPNNLDRALRILDAVAKDAEHRGWTVDATAAFGRSSVGVLGENVGFAITEKIRREVRRREQRRRPRLFRAALTEDEWLAALEDDGDEKPWDFHPTGVLTLSVSEWIRADRKRFVDGPGRPVEAQLGEFMVAVLVTAAAKRRDRLETEQREREKAERERLAAEAEKRRREEEARIAELERQAAAWAKAQELRAFIDAAASSGAALLGKAGADEWAAWARAYADRLDPLNSSGTPRAASETASTGDLPDALGSSRRR